MVTRKRETKWVTPSEMTEPELVREYERAERRRKAGVHDPKDLMLEREIERRASEAPEVGLC